MLLMCRLRFRELPLFLRSSSHQFLSSLQWLPLVKLPGKTEIKVATMRNDAGIVGAAVACLAKAALDYRLCVTVDELTDA
jgi:hypothetical protein